MRSNECPSGLTSGYLTQNTLTFHLISRVYGVYANVFAVK